MVMMSELRLVFYLDTFINGKKFGICIEVGMLAQYP